MPTDSSIISPGYDKAFSAFIDGMSFNIMSRNALQGFWPTGRDRNKLEMHMLMCSEVAGMTKAVRRQEPQTSAKLPEFSEEEEELADLVIRALDYAGGFRLRLGDAILAKLKYNVNLSGTIRPADYCDFLRVNVHL